MCIVHSVLYSGFCIVETITSLLSDSHRAMNMVVIECLASEKFNR